MSAIRLIAMILGIVVFEVSVLSLIAHHGSYHHHARPSVQIHTAGLGKPAQ